MSFEIKFLLSVVAGIMGIFLLAFFLSSVICSQKWIDYDSRWSVLGGCQVQVDGKWTPEERVRIINL